MHITSCDVGKLLAWSSHPPTRRPSESWDPCSPARMPYVYMLASQKNGTLYIGVTRDLIKRVYEHKSGFVPGFSRQYQVKRLVWYQQCDSIISAIQREKQMKAWKRDWKIQLIEQANPYWHDLYPALLS